MINTKTELKLIQEFGEEHFLEMPVIISSKNYHLTYVPKRRELGYIYKVKLSLCLTKHHAMKMY
jgi:hypothetical protein